MRRFRALLAVAGALGLVVLAVLAGALPASAQVEPTNSPATGQPVISGKAQVGETLTADVSEIVDADGLDNATFDYQWIANDGATDADIENATDAAYTPVPDDEGKVIKVRVSFTDDAGNPEELTSDSTAAVAPPNNPATGVPVINGIARQGELLTVNVSGISDVDGMENATLEYYWDTGGYAYGGYDHDGQSGKYWCSYAPTCTIPRAAVVGSVIRVIVYFTDDAGNLEELTSEPTAPVTGIPTILNTKSHCNIPQVGSDRVFADPWTIDDVDGFYNAKFSYQWIVNDGTGDSDLEGETGYFYTPGADDVGKTLRVRVSYTDDAGNPESATSVPTRPVFPANTPATGVPVISGTARVGETLTGSTDGISDADGLDYRGFTYIWTAIDPNTGAEVRRKARHDYWLDHDPIT